MSNTTQTEHLEHVLAQLSEVLKYPEEGYGQTVQRCYALCQDVRENPGLRKFRDFVIDADLADLEELYIGTFDMNAKRALEVGWHLYGEQYKRGQFLVKMRELLNRYNIEENGELPDHLIFCLMVLEKMPADDATGFVWKYVQPAISKMLEGFADENPFRYVILTIQQVLEQEFGEERS